MQSLDLTMSSWSFFSHDALDDIISCSVFLRFCYFQLPVWQFFVLHHLSLLMFYLRLIHYFCFLHHYNHLVNIVFTRWSRFLFAYFSKYLQTKTIAWKGDCVIFLKLQMLQRWSKPYWKALAKFSKLHEIELSWDNPWNF